MRFPVLLSVLGCALAWPAGAQSPGLDEAPFAIELNRRSDSLSRLAAATELKVAIDSGDWRFLGVVGYVVVAPGVDFNDPLYPRELRDIRIIEGTSDMQLGDAGRRFNEVAAGYAERYNRLLRERLRKLRTRR